MVEHGKRESVSARILLRRDLRIRRFDRDYAKVLERYDVLISPTAAPAPPLGYLATDLPYETHYDRVRTFAAFTPLQNVRRCAGDRAAARSQHTRLPRLPASDAASLYGRASLNLNVNLVHLALAFAPVGARNFLAS